MKRWLAVGPAWGPRRRLYSREDRLVDCTPVEYSAFLVPQARHCAGTGWWNDRLHTGACNVSRLRASSARSAVRSPPPS